MQVSERGLRLIEAFEGYSGSRYYDSVGVATIGYGTTAAVLGYVPASCTRAQAEGWLRTSVSRSYGAAVDRAAGRWLNQNQFDALVSLAYNCGPGIVGSGYQMGRDLARRAVGACAGDFMHYVYGQGGVYLAGLANRRRAERALFLTPAVAPDPYRLFANQTFKFSRRSLASTIREHPNLGPTFRGSVLSLNEKLTVREHDRLVRTHASHDAVYRHRLWIMVLRKRVWWLAHNAPSRRGWVRLRHPRWDSNHLGYRWHELNKRSEGMA